MAEPIVVIMAGGRGSRYGGLKQLDPVGPNGEVIMDYSIFDAARAGFRRFVLVIREETKKQFEEELLSHLPTNLEIHLAMQKVQDLPASCKVPAGRSKPLGTAHALYAGREFIDAPFVVINADDYYGPEAFQLIYDFLKEERPSGDYAMTAFYLGNTLTENGAVNRGLCQVEAGRLQSVREQTEISKIEPAADRKETLPKDQCLQKGGKETLPKGRCLQNGKEVILNGETLVSMNFWAFQPDILQDIEEALYDFFAGPLQKDPMGAELYLPDLIMRQLREEKAQVQVLETGGQWMGITYREDRESLMTGLSAAHEEGLYPTPLWS